MQVELTEPQIYSDTAVLLFEAGAGTNYYLVRNGENIFWHNAGGNHQLN